MARNLYATVGACVPDNLVADNLVYQKHIEVTLTDAGEYHRGQLLTVASDGKATIIAAAEVDIGGVLLTEVGEIGTDGPIRAAAAITGEFNENSVLWGSVADANKDALIAAARLHQLYIEPMVKAPYLQFGEE